ncbi:oxidoreductase [Pseudoxanthomonas kalamensis DSM 18571]|nr:oxidoreductase [Pseudoxanthomonas kalamensis DSM 18571]
MEPPRAYLGASAIGRECDRQLWYGFRWATGGEQFDGRMKRLFNRGHREEPVFIEELRAIGCTVKDIDPSTGDQFRFKAVGGHVGCGLDSVILGVPEASKTWHLGEYKTHNAKSFAALVKDGVAKSKPEHYAQVQLCMKLSELTRTLYLAVNKDTDELHAERIHYDSDFADRVLTKAERIVYAPEPLPRLSDDPAFFKCKFCPASQVCHASALPQVSCRTCLHATPEPDGDGRWSCAKFNCDLSVDIQRASGEQCRSHLYIPALLHNWGEAVDASQEDGWVEYRATDGLVFRNGPWGVTSFTSKELFAASPELLRNEQFMSIRRDTNARIVEGSEWKDAA